MGYGPIVRIEIFVYILSMKDAILEVKNLSVVRNNHIILDKISFNVMKDETVAVIGPNGAGKTTLFKALLGLTPYTGEVIWAPKIRIGYVPQKLYVEADMPLTTYEFFSLKERDKNKIRDALTSVGLTDGAGQERNVEEHILGNRLGFLSGGELQRVMIAWALLGNPDVLLFDEPTAGVDVVGEETIYSMLERLRSLNNLTIMLISHELEIVYKYATKVVCINKERICFGPPKDALDKESIEKLFGEEVHFYVHDHRH